MNSLETIKLSLKTQFTLLHGQSSQNLVQFCPCPVWLKIACTDLHDFGNPVIADLGYIDSLFYRYSGHPKGTRKRKHNNEKSIKLNIIIQLSHSHNIVNEIKFASPFFQFSDIFCPKSLKVPILI